MEPGDEVTTALLLELERLAFDAAVLQLGRGVNGYRQLDGALATFKAARDGAADRAALDGRLARAVVDGISSAVAMWANDIDPATAG